MSISPSTSYSPQIPELFSPWSMRRRTGYYWPKNYTGPTVGELVQFSFPLGYLFRLQDTYLINRNFGYVLQVNELTEEVLVHCPFLLDAPWCKDEWYLVDFYDCNKVTMYRFDEASFRTRTKEKPCPYPFVWGTLVDGYNRRYYQRADKIK